MGTNIVGGDFLGGKFQAGNFPGGEGGGSFLEPLLMFIILIKVLATF